MYFFFGFGNLKCHCWGIPSYNLWNSHVRTLQSCCMHTCMETSLFLIGHLERGVLQKWKCCTVNSQYACLLGKLANAEMHIQNWSLSGTIIHVWHVYPKACIPGTWLRWCGFWSISIHATWYCTYQEYFISVASLWTCMWFSSSLCSFPWSFDSTVDL